MRHFALMFILACLSVTTVSAQNCLHTGTLTGVVLDPTGAVIRGASVQANFSDSRVQSVSSGGDGRWTLACLASGAYRLQVSSPGFQSTQTELLRVQSNRVSSVTIKLQIESVTEKVDVDSGENNNRSDGANVLSAKQLEGLAEDPDDLQRQLQALAAAAGGMPGSALITVDGFQTRHGYARRSVPFPSRPGWP